MLNGLPASPTVVMVERTIDHQPAILLGFLATGDEASKVALERAANRAKFHTGRSKNDKNQDEVMVTFAQGGDPGAAIQLYHDAVSGRFGSLSLEVVLVPVSKLGSGFDLGRDAEVDPPSAMTEPPKR